MNKYIEDSNKNINNYTLKSLKFIKTEFINIIKFLLIDNHIITVAVGFIIATQTNNIATLLIDNIIAPIIYKIITFYTKQPINKLENYEYEYLGIKFEVGKLIINLLKFIIILIIIYYICQLTNTNKLNKLIYKIDHIISE
jgi:large-conductance mechanosensitive channel